MVLIHLLSQLFTYKFFSFLRFVLNHNGALSTDLISSDLTSLPKYAQLIRTSFQNVFLIWIPRFLAYYTPSNTTLSKSIRVENVPGCIICLLNYSAQPTYFKALMKAYT